MRGEFYMKRIEQTYSMLKAQFHEIGDEWKQTRDNALIDELHALVSAINALEIHLYDRKYTTLLDI